MISNIKSIFGVNSDNKYGFTTDFHSHLLPGLDDGVRTFEQSLELILELKKTGITKIITTPHIYNSKYNNSPETILPKLEELKSYLKTQNCEIEIEAAAEYYLDDFFLNKIKNNEPLLTFGDKHILFELSYINESHLIHEAVYLLLSNGYSPILAHPERYNYYHFNLNKYQILKNYGLSFQLNINSLSGYYEDDCKKMAQKLIDADMIDFVGSDTHHGNHILALQKSLNSTYYKKLLSKDIKNNEL